MDMLCFFRTYLHESSCAGGLAPNATDLLKILYVDLGFAELAREQMKQNGKPISTCASLAICSEIGVHLV